MTVGRLGGTLIPMNGFRAFAASAFVLSAAAPALAHGFAAPRAAPPHVSAPHVAAPRPAVTHTAPPAAAHPSNETQFRGRGFVPSVQNLNLSADQSERIRGIIESTRQANAGVDPQTRRDNVQKMRQQIWQTLTPEQRDQFKLERSRQPETPPSP
jgi:Spy/CpxP family protein refolding chaperone